MARDDKNGDPIAKEMGQRIAAARKERGWTQDRLAHETGWRQADADHGRARGLSPSRLGNYEQGTRRLDVEEAEILSGVFGLPAAYFLAAITRYEADILVAIQTREPTRITR